MQLLQYFKCESCGSMAELEVDQESAPPRTGAVLW